VCQDHHRPAGGNRIDPTQQIGLSGVHFTS
jgi:hypothetical protein